MNIHLITGGARSGKSTHAENRAVTLGGNDVTYIATAAPHDDEMAARIRAHRAARPAGWTTAETNDVAAAIRDARTDTILLDCLTLHISNVLLAAPQNEHDVLAATAAATKALLDAADARTGSLIIVTNEVGLGVVPPTELGRWFRDALGRANQEIAARAVEVVMMVSGMELKIKTS